MNAPTPQLRNNLPDGSKARIGGSVRPAHEFSKHRWTTNIVPSGPGSAPMTAPHFRPAGICAQLASRRYGLGRSLSGRVCFHLGSVGGCSAPDTVKRLNASVAGMCFMTTCDVRNDGAKWPLVVELPDTYR